MTTIKKRKFQNGGATADSSAYFKKEWETNKSNTISALLSSSNPDYSKQIYEKGAAKGKELADAYNRQSKKGKPGYDANGFPKKRTGGKITKAKCGTKVKKGGKK